MQEEQKIQKPEHIKPHIMLPFANDSTANAPFKMEHAKLTFFDVKKSINYPNHSHMDRIHTIHKTFLHVFLKQ